MGFRAYVKLWLVLSIAIALENLALNYQPDWSFTQKMVDLGWLSKDFNLSPHAGRPVSLFLGWLGISLICITNFYIVRKRWGAMKSFGNLPGWLDFHIFCGMLGPTLIVFHTNFKVGGLVSISFWSMVIVAVSGILGRYFYIQVLSRKAELVKDIGDNEKILLREFKVAGTDLEKVWQDKRAQLLKFVGLDLDASSALKIMMLSLTGDVRMAFSTEKSFPGFHNPIAFAAAKKFAIGMRRQKYFDVFQNYLGYWHAFHLPFAVFMYLVAIIHIAAALMFGVSD